MEKIKIDKERTWIFSPVNNIVIKVDIKGNLLEEQIKKAINDTVYHYDMFHLRIVFDKEGNAYYQIADFLNLLYNL